MSQEHCIRTIIDETQTTLTKEEVADVVEMLIQYDIHPRNRQVFGPFSPEQGRIQQELESTTNARLVEARDILIARARLVAAQQRANVVMDAEKRAVREISYNAAPDTSLGIQSKLVGTNTPFHGSRDSAAAAIEGNVHNLLGAFDRELKANGLDRLFANRSLEREWARELEQLNMRNGQPGITGNRQAQQIAQAIYNMQRAGVEMLNTEGAFVGSYNGYISKTTHSAHLLRRMGEDEWVSLAQRHFDIDTIYPNRAPEFIDNALREQYRRIASGLHDSYDPAELDVITYSAGQNMAKKVSERRVIHFKSADDWLAYMEQASEMTPTQVIFQSAMSMSRDAGLMRVWGTNPKRALETDFVMSLQRARDAGDMDLVQRLNEQRRHYDLWMSYMTGEANHVHNQTANLIVHNTLAVQRMAKLGFLPFAQLTDLASVAGELRYQGVGFVDRLTATLGGYIRGGHGSEKRQVSELLNAFIEGEIGQYGALMEVNDPRISGGFTGRIHQIQEWFFRYTGAMAMTNRARGSVMVMMSRNLGQHKDTPWVNMDAPEQRIMQAFSIGEHEWDALRQAPWLVGNEGRTYLTPRDALAIPDAAIDAYNQATGTVNEYGAFRRQMADRLYAYYADRMDYGVLQPGVAERAILYQGAAADTPLGAALRLAMQFKSFTVAMLRRTWGREIYGGQSSMGAIGGLMQFFILGTILGIVSNGLNQLLKGQDPTSQWDEFPTQAVLAGFTRAGAASIMGDYLFGQWNRHGTSLAAYALGPTMGEVERFSSIYAALVRGENPSGDVIRFARSITPFTNMFYTKLATDWLFWNALTEAANPGYLRRMQRRLKKDQGIEFLGTPGFVESITGDSSFAPSEWQAGN
jgi:hypothetical protein